MNPTTEMSASKPNATDINGKYSALLVGTEVGIGSILHAWHIPGAGHALSLNQGFLLSRATQKSRRPRTAIEISLIGSSLKSLSPAGKRLTPMLAIVIQGFLFASGQLIFGVNPVGTTVGFVLLSLWAFIQPLLLSFAVFGTEWISIGQDVLKKIQEFIPLRIESIVVILMILISVKILLAIGFVFLSYSRKSERTEVYLQKLSKRAAFSQRSMVPLSSRQRFALVLHDLSRPWFLGSLVILSISLLFVSSDWEKALLYFLRSVAMAFITFYALRFLPVQRWAKRAFKSTFPLERV